MGTRHLIAIQSNNEYKLAQYGQWDGYPSGVGVELLERLKKYDHKVLKENVNKLRYITKEEVEQLAELDPSEYEDLLKNNPQFSRDTSYDVIDLLMNVDSWKLPTVRNYIEFANDSLFCEWAYVIDFDKGTFEVFEGFNKLPLSQDERFYNATTESEYHPVKHLVSFDLSDLPSEEAFLEKTGD